VPGEHSEEILEDLEYEDAAIAALHAKQPV
jgi:crotonobetainyl-CoA:carnitine CoA-transferase CaiB-like acyl-CoA transferase